MNRTILITALVAALLLPLLTGCGDSRPENCLVDDEGFFTFSLIRGETEYPFSFRGSLVSAEPQFTDPPTIRYLFALDGGGSINLDTNDLGWIMPLTVDTTYDVELDLVVDEWLETYSVVIRDDAGVAVIAESDWLAANNTDRFDYVLSDNDYSDLDLTVSNNDPGCEAREVNTPEFLTIHNRRLEFKMDDQRLELGHAESGTLAGYTFHVWRAQAQLAKQTNDPEHGNIQPQISFYLERSDLP